ncbi:MAG TPA: DUF1028 domain-containing protein [Chloroflexi bacterium]|nr:MAG: fimbrial assembly protein FimA [Chloroflexota bacterium]HDN04973.1 DUF1028 domain-containing protein [Chloroflexota bacterium]
MVKLIHTFSIVAYAPEKGEWGVAVQSKFLAAAAVVSWARANAGAVATQSFANVTYGLRGLDLMEEGISAEEAIRILTENDENKDLRQIGLVDCQGRASAFTGEKCYEWAGHVVGDGFACQGNILVPGTLEAMAAEFEKVRGKEGELADWLVLALEAGQAAGGDKRGRQAAGVLVVREGGGYGGDNDRYLDLRVDDDPSPIQKLKQLVDSHHLYFGDVDPEDLVPLNTVIQELQDILLNTGHLLGKARGRIDEKFLDALRALVGEENLEERWNGDKESIDRKVVDYLRNKFGG